MSEGEKSLRVWKRDVPIGILTFHCADNFGALLQAYGLKTWLRTHSFDAKIVPYAPFYMTRRHWLIQLPEFKRGVAPSEAFGRALPGHGGIYRCCQAFCSRKSG